MERKKNIFDKIRPYVYISPLMIAVVLLSLLPILYTVYIGFTNLNGNHMQDYHFVGFYNFQQILTGPLRPIFAPVFLWTFAFAILAALGSYLIGLLFAIPLSNPNIKERNICKAFLIVPWAMPATITTISWSGLLNEQYGGVNVLLRQLHIINKNIPWLSDPNWARLAVVLVTFWLGFPWMMNICLAALSAIPDTYYEAADMDGATKFQKFIKITLPSLTSSSLPLIISSFAYNFNNFGSAYLITQGNPPMPGTQYAGYTDILASAGYKLTYTNFRYDYAGALSVLIFIVIGTISFIQMKATRAFEEVE